MCISDWCILIVCALFVVVSNYLQSAVLSTIVEIADGTRLILFPKVPRFFKTGALGDARTPHIDVPLER